MIRIRIELSPERKKLYEEALTRLRGVETTEGSGADALIIGNSGQAMESSAPCLLDRPEAISLAQLEALASSRPRLMPAHLWRFLPDIRQVHESHGGGHLGEPGLLRIHHWRPERQPLEQLVFGEVDLAHWFFGATPVCTRSLAAPDYLQLHLGFSNDGMAVIDVAASRPGPHSYYSMHLIGSDGAAYADDHHNAHLLLDQRGTKALLHARPERLGVTNMLAEFINGMREDRDWSVSLPDSVKARRTIQEVTRA